MGERDAAFFEELRNCRHIGALNTTVGTIRFDIRHGDRTHHWRVMVDRGEIIVSPGNGDADGVFEMDEVAFRRLADGATVPFAAFLSNEMGIKGKFAMLVVMQHLFHGAPGAHHPRQLVDQDGWRS